MTYRLAIVSKEIRIGDVFGLYCFPQGHPPGELLFEPGREVLVERAGETSYRIKVPDDPRCDGLILFAHEIFFM